MQRRSRILNELLMVILYMILNCAMNVLIHVIYMSVFDYKIVRTVKGAGLGMNLHDVKIVLVVYDYSKNSIVSTINNTQKKNIMNVSRKA